MPRKKCPQISSRKSSAVPFRPFRKRVAEEDKENEPECEGPFTGKDAQEIVELEKSLAQSHKRLKAKGSFGVDFWSQNKVLIETEIRWNSLKRKQSVHDFVARGGKKILWKEEQQAGILREEKHSLDLRLRCIEQQIDRLAASVDNGTTTITRRWFIKLLNTAPVFKGGIGAGNTSGQDPRPGHLQSCFRKRLIEAGGSAGGAQGVELWCPVLGDYIAPQAIVAAHIFPYSAGQEAMDNLFGRVNGRSEMFEPENGLMLSREAETNIALGFMAIVPNLPDEPTKQEQAAWNQARVKSYKLEIINEKVKGCVPRMPPGYNDSNGNRLWWKSQHGGVLQFKSDFRPRTRYLWWQWAVSHLRKIWRDLEEKKRPDLKLLNRPFWGTIGSYIRKRPLFTLAEEVGAPFESLMDAVIDGEEGSEDEAGAGDEEGFGALITADFQLRQTRLRDEKDEEEFLGFYDEDETDEEEFLGFPDEDGNDEEDGDQTDKAL